jgi:hypothetical protein
MSVISQLRSATNADDSAFIVEMARHACVIEDWPLPDADDEEVQGLLPRSGDIAVVAADAVGIGVGSVWTFHHNPRSWSATAASSCRRSPSPSLPRSGETVSVARSTSASRAPCHSAVDVACGGSSAR